MSLDAQDTSTGLTSAIYRELKTCFWSGEGNQAGCPMTSEIVDDIYD